MNDECEACGHELPEETDHPWETGDCEQRTCPNCEHENVRWTH